MIEHFNSTYELPISWKRRLSMRDYKCNWCNKPIYNNSPVVTISHRLGKQLLVNFYHERCKHEQEETEQKCRESDAAQAQTLEAR